MWPYYIGLVLIILNILIFVATIIILYSRSSDIGQRKEYKNAIVAGLLVLALFIAIFIVNGRQWVYTTNWMYHHEELVRPKHNFQLPNRLNIRCILNVLAMILAGKIINYSNHFKHFADLHDCLIILS